MQADGKQKVEAAKSLIAAIRKMPDKYKKVIFTLLLEVIREKVLK